MRFSNYAAKDTFLRTGKATSMLFLEHCGKKGDIPNHNKLIFGHNSQGGKQSNQCKHQEKA